MDDRRDFLKKLMAGVAVGATGLGNFALGSSGTLTELRASLDDSRNDEEFWKKVRKQFRFNQDQVYLNCATLGLMPDPVIAKIEERFSKLRMGRYNIDPDSREGAARLLGATVEEISLTHNTTEGINIIAQGLPLRRRDEVIVTDQEHVGNALPWLNRARRDRIRLRPFTPASTAAETLNRINDLIGRRTRAIAVPHITCTTGQVLPAKEIAKLARDKGLYVFFDGAHGAGTLQLDMKEIDCDFYSTCGHKWLCGPAGTGMLYVKKERLADLEPLMVGAYSDTGWTLNTSEQSMQAFVDTAHRFDYGTQNNALFMGMNAAIEFMEAIGWERVLKRTHGLAKALQQKLIELDFVEMLTPLEDQSRCSMVGFRLKGRKFEDLRESWDAMRYRVRFVPESGLNSMRISTHLFNTEEELDGFIGYLKEMMV